MPEIEYRQVSSGHDFGVTHSRMRTAHSDKCCRKKHKGEYTDRLHRPAINSNKTGNIQGDLALSLRDESERLQARYCVSNKPRTYEVMRVLTALI
jgi:hypothetical protein